VSDTREHILNAAFNLFLRKNYKEVTMAELVEKTGLSKGAFYHYFESKEKLFLEVINNSVSSVSPDFSKFNKCSFYEFYHQYIAYLDKILNSFEVYGNTLDSELSVNYYSLIFDALRLYPSFQEKMIEFEQIELNSWKEIICTARKNGEIKSYMNDEQIAKVFIYTNDGVSIRNVFMKGKSDDATGTLLALWDSLYEVLKA
jgi:TetR/AcrR family transcriptional regulator, transcriptional repressor for nem operon